MTSRLAIFSDDLEGQAHLVSGTTPADKPLARWPGPNPRSSSQSVANLVLGGSGATLVFGQKFRGPVALSVLGHSAVQSVSSSFEGVDVEHLAAVFLQDFSGNSIVNIDGAFIRNYCHLARFSDLAPEASSKLNIFVPQAFVMRGYPPNQLSMSEHVSGLTGLVAVWLGLEKVP